MQLYTIVIFDKTTRLYKSHIITNEIGSVVIVDEQLSAIADENFQYIYGRLYRLKDDDTIEMLSEKPTRFHIWNETDWVEDLDEKIRILSGEIRDLRLYHLQQIDAIVENPFRYNELTDEQKTELAQYRRELLDLPQQIGFPLDVVFPSKPPTIQ
jgi:hypothetical protein